MPDHFTIDPTSDGLIVEMKGEPPVPVSEWTAHVTGAGALIRLRDDGGAVEHEGAATRCVSRGEASLD